MPDQSAPVSSFLRYFSEPEEFVQSAYLQLLHREGEPSGLSYWVEKIKNGLNYSDVVDDFINSPEYLANATTSQVFITSLYQNLLHRSPDAEGLEYWTKLLSVTSNDFVVNRFLDSKEFQTDASSQSNLLSHFANLASMEGGGFRALTTDSGLVAGLIKYFHDTRGSKIDISNFFNHVDAVSSNSGSSWFTSLLSYSSPFKDSLQDYKNLFDSRAGGYMGLVGQHYISYLGQNYDPSKSTANDYSKFNAILHDLPDLNWANLMEQTVYAPYDTFNILKGINFHTSIQNRTDALSTQSLIHQLSISVDQAGISPYSGIGELVATVTNAGNRPLAQSYTFIPAAVTSTGLNRDQNAVNLPTIHDGSLELTYKNVSNLNPGTTSSINVIAPNINFNGLSVFSTSAASSSVLADEASIGASGNSPMLLQLTQELATPSIIELYQSSSQGGDYPDAPGKNYPIVSHITLQDVTTNPIVRLADGHYTDTTSVTAGMSSFNSDKLKDGFNVTLFSNYAYSDYISVSTIDPKVLSILGIGQEPNNQTAGTSLSGNPLNLSHPSNQVFSLVNVPDPTNWNPTPKWSYHSLTDQFVINYYEIAVKTTPGNYYATSDQYGTLKLWEVVTSAGMGTQPTQQGWEVYSNLYAEIIQALQTSNNGEIGAVLLGNSLGLL